MNIDLSAIDRNPSIDPGHYMAKVERVETEDCGAAKPRLRVDVRLGQNNSVFDGKRFTAILHPSRKSEFLFDGLEGTFNIQNGRYREAVGRWGMVYIRDNHYQGTKHSVVKFYKQSDDERAAAKEIEATEAARRQATTPPTGDEAVEGPVDIFAT
jgi:hypothetical protein